VVCESVVCGWSGVRGGSGEGGVGEGGGRSIFVSTLTIE
jgi:hypothetical protein